MGSFRPFGLIASAAMAYVRQTLRRHLPLNVLANFRTLQHNLIAGTKSVTVDSKKRLELWAEAIRDIGILFFVFAPIDTLLHMSFKTWDWHYLMSIGIAVAGLLLIWKGVRMVTETETDT